MNFTKSKKARIIVVGALASTLLFSCGQNGNSSDTSTDSQTEKSMKDNSLLKQWEGPYGGVPAFDQMQLEDLQPAMEHAMNLHLEEIERIADNQEDPTFENTILPYEKSGQELDRAFTYYGIWSSNMSSPEFREIQERLAPIISDYSSDILQNEQFFNRVEAVYEASLQDPLPDDQQRTVLLIYESFALEGADLNAEAKERYAAINKELSQLYTKFSNNILADEENYVVYFTEEQAGGLPESYLASAEKAAAERNREGEYAVLNTRSYMDPFLSFSDQRELRKEVWNNYYSRGDNNDEFDNKSIIKEILKLRDQRVGLLGFENYAQWRLQNRMAKTPENAMDLMMAVWPSALKRVEQEVADMQAIADAEGAGIKIEPWDYRYYAEKVRQQKYDLDSDEIKQYLQLGKLTDAIFYVAGELFNYSFSPVPDGSVPVFHEDVKVWEVTDTDSEEHIGLFYLDPFARTGKRSGAWATMYRSHSDMGEKETVLASNNSNFIKPAPGEPVLVSWDDAQTFFHEFGHALHFLASEVKYSTLNSGVRDYTEFQSQLLERWLSTEAVIDQFLVHYETGEPIPDELVAKIQETSTFNQGFATTEFLASALMDMKLHTTDPEDIDMDTFERETLQNLGMPSEIVMRHRTPHFGHVFSGEGYATGYYGYLWADVLTSDAAEAFAEAPGGFYDEQVSERLVEYLFAPRNAMDPAEAYRLFRGRDAEIDALMRDRGFPVPSDDN